MEIQEFTASQLGLEQNLTQELRVYTEKWFQRMSQERQTNELQAIVHKAFEELLIHTFTPETIGTLFPGESMISYSVISAMRSHLKIWQHFLGTLKSTVQNFFGIRWVNHSLSISNAYALKKPNICWKMKP